MPSRCSASDLQGRLGRCHDADVDALVTQRRHAQGGIEDDHPCATSNAPGLDDDGLPNDEIAIADDAIGARVDGSQG